MVEYVYARHDFAPEHEDEIAFRAGERIEVVEKDEVYNDGWWQVSIASSRIVCRSNIRCTLESPLFTLARPHGFLEAFGVLESTSLLSYTPSHTYSVRINVVGALAPILMSATHTPDPPHNFLSVSLLFCLFFPRAICTTRPLYAFIVLVSTIANSVPFPPTPGPQPRGEGRPFPRGLHPARSTEYWTCC